jgi:nucleotide-binding universal stress UspA family protein
VSDSSRALSVPAIKSILYATDFSPASQAALPFVRAIARRYGATVHVLHALSPHPREAVTLEPGPELEDDRSKAEAAMCSLLAADALRDVTHTATVERGALWDVLSEVAAGKQADLIVVGTHGRGGLSKLVLGSNAEQVFRRASAPVLSVGPHVSDGHRAEAGGAPVVFATDFSSGSEHALPYAISLARATHSPLVLVHGVQPPVMQLPAAMDSVAVDPRISAEILAEIVSAARRQLGELIPEGEARELNAEFVAECAPAADLILSTAEKRKAGVIVMGAHQASAHSAISHLPWATASAVVRGAHCPVLTVRS